MLKESCEGTKCAICIGMKVHVWDLVHMLPADFLFIGSLGGNKFHNKSVRRVYSEPFLHFAVI